MADLQDIETYLIEHPDDHDQRWRLAKKLYMACEYRDALSHLLILKRDADWKLNHSRYLAATYYRLGRYDECVQELQGAMESWPHEIPIREQLARAYEVASNTDAAVRVWQDILKIDPQHPIATQTIHRLTTAEEEPSSEIELRLNESDSGINLSPGTTCPKCGARNSLEFDRCWQCHALLSAPGTPTPEMRKPVSPSTPARFWTVLIGLAAVALLARGVYLTLSYAASRPVAVDGFIVASSVDSLLDHEWFAGRVAAGCTLLVVWPAILWLAAITCCEQPVPFRRVLGIGLLAASLTYVLMWLPYRMLPFAVAAPVVLTLVLIPLLFRGTLFRALIVWAVQIVLALLCGFGVFAAVTNVATFNHMDTLAALDTARATEMPGGAVTFSAAEVPAEYTIYWKETPSVWVNSAGRLAEFTFRRSSSDAPVTVEFAEAGHTLIYRQDQVPPFSFSHAIAPGRTYGLRVQSRRPDPVEVRISGLLVPQVTDRQAAQTDPSRDRPDAASESLPGRGPAGRDGVRTGPR